MDKELAESIGAAARDARKVLGLTQEDAAERIGVSAEFYARIERGNALPSVPTLSRIANSLQVSADILLGFRDGAPSALHISQTKAAPETTEDSPEMRRLMRRLRKAPPGSLRLVALLLKEIARVQNTRPNEPE